MPASPLTAPQPTTAPASTRPIHNKARLEFFENPEGLFGLRDAHGQVVVAPRYRAVYPFTVHDVAFVVDDHEWMCIDRGGHRLVTMFTFDNGPDYAKQGLMRYVDGTKVGFVDEACQIRIVALWEHASWFSEGLAVVCQDCRIESDGEHSQAVGGKWGYIDQKGATVVPPIYDFAAPFVDGCGEVVLEGRTIVIDRSGRPKGHQSTCR